MAGKNSIDAFILRGFPERFSKKIGKGEDVSFGLFGKIYSRQEGNWNVDGGEISDSVRLLLRYVDKGLAAIFRGKVYVYSPNGNVWAKAILGGGEEISEYEIVDKKSLIRGLNVFLNKKLLQSSLDAKKKKKNKKKELKEKVQDVKREIKDGEEGNIYFRFGDREYVRNNEGNWNVDQGEISKGVRLLLNFFGNGQVVTYGEGVYFYKRGEDAHWEKIIPNSSGGIERTVRIKDSSLEGNLYPLLK